jgi:5-formyltetrahydrofolate cyclo-ligase
VTDVAVQKRRLRASIDRLRRALAPEVRQRAGDAVARRVLAMPELAAARRVALYASLPDELPTDRLLRAVLASGRTLLLPRVEDRRLVFAAVGALTELRPGRLGILEPGPDRPSTPWEADDLVLVPGVAFDRRGGRLGRGGGFYDRALPVRDGPLVIGLAFELQIVAQVPCAPHDRPVDGYVTEAGLHRVRPEARPFSDEVR